MDIKDILLLIAIIIVYTVIIFLLGGEFKTSGMANGAVKCEMIRDTKVCWNPKDEIKNVE